MNEQLKIEEFEDITEYTFTEQNDAYLKQFIISKGV